MKTSEEKTKQNGEDKDFTSILKGKPPTPSKELYIAPDSGTAESVLKSYLPIVEMVVKKEYRSIPSYLAEYGELINIGLLSVNKLLKESAKNNKTYNSSYIAQAVKWAIKDELRVRYSWYGVKQNKSSVQDVSNETDKSQDEAFDSENEVKDITELTKEEAAEKIFETILYLEDFPRETAGPEQMTGDELTRLELVELKNAIKRAIDKLPERHKRVIELRFFEGKRGNDIAEGLGVTPSRVSHMIQDAIEKVKQYLMQEGYSQY